MSNWTQSKLSLSPVWTINISESPRLSKEQGNFGLDIGNVWNDLLFCMVGYLDSGHKLASVVMVSTSSSLLLYPASSMAMDFPAASRMPTEASMVGGLDIQVKVQAISLNPLPGFVVTDASHPSSSFDSCWKDCFNIVNWQVSHLWQNYQHQHVNIVQIGLRHHLNLAQFDIIITVRNNKKIKK